MPDFPERARRDLLAIYDAALAAADPRAAVEKVLRDPSLTSVIDECQSGGAMLLALGKAAATMALGAQAALGSAIRGGVVVTSAGSAREGLAVPLVEGGHPVPDEGSLRGGAALLNAAREAGHTGRVALVLLSGGASALAELPQPPITLAELQETTQLLLRSGAAIGEVNAVRKHLSALKGGQLALAAAPATTATLVLSDVVGSPLDAIGSGPTVPDSSTWSDAQRVLAARDLVERVPASVRARVEAGAAGLIADTPKSGDEVLSRGVVRIVGDAALAAEAARAEAARRGWPARVVDAHLQGDAEAFARSLPARIAAEPRPACLIFAGETTVVVRGKGRGGRNQQLALRFASEISGAPGIALAALATDGVDGPTDAAGAIVDGATAARAAALGFAPAAALADNDAHPALEAAGALIKRGPTGTNVNDLFVLLIE